MFSFFKNLWIRFFGSSKRWEIGPTINGKNSSVGVEKRLIEHNGEHYFDIPLASGHVNYVTRGYGPLKGKKSITLNYRIEADEGVQIVPKGSAPDHFPSILTLYIQRRGDNWSGRGEYEAYRWYATFASVMPIVPGTHTLTVPLDGNWTGVQLSQAMYSPERFAKALNNADRVGFVLGGNTGFGHGVYATGHARFIIRSFEIN